MQLPQIDTDNNIQSAKENLSPPKPNEIITNSNMESIISDQLSKLHQLMEENISLSKKKNSAPKIENELSSTEKKSDTTLKTIVEEFKESR